ncbi:MAG: hypothetical protein AAFR10_20420 [Pseudomonadota bacterium]
MNRKTACGAHALPKRIAQMRFVAATKFEALEKMVLAASPLATIGGFAAHFSGCETDSG